jgi:glyoxylase-like metal-dependent hydrolase (beta-lactamase superfamily II)
MSVVATEVLDVSPGVFRWECFSPAHKVELTSHAVLAEGQLYVFDPIYLAETPKKQLLAGQTLAAIVLTNDNHERVAAGWHASTSAPIWAEAGASIALAGVNRWVNTPVKWGPWEVIPLAGGAGGEIALCWRERSLVVLGDAIFNLAKYGFSILPEKYCQNQGKLRESLLRLTEKPFETVLFAHGAPILKGASARIREVLKT